ncbi:poly-gamma-glutamate capsule synthesis protein PGA_cap [Geotalea daltonii FRC-32]|uniref:Poly-gamma-glutamate capsule synthesis protein PGA_cap n=1 Tax=Geotalea daltonii (strain DSM 22248 / JCM 15807 / FRC-32) TaxID=316067 RepID=B9M412_GEODF|nr:CapA family protein [Geotalea daltonii]ACM19655.1 poly-gamma-glutamate capsule synthesis protein PGA_cap [Geotalea daltonii FRC-32]
MGRDKLITIFMCGDVMTGRGIDQILPHPGDPAIHEPYMKDARGYVALAEETNGLIPKSASFYYIWGDALEVLSSAAPDLRIINLETSVTKSDDYWQGKGINYRMSPDNFPAITAARIDFCSLANNHILDWGNSGLAETLSVLDKAHVKHGGAGRDLAEARMPAVFDVEGKGRVLVFSCGTESSGIPGKWGAGEKRAGVNLLPDLSRKTVGEVARMVQRLKRPGDLVVLSIHWGANWGYSITPDERAFAHGLVDDAGVDVIHGHSSHHVKGMEVYHGKPIIYGCGDFINDYEGIHGEERFRGDLSLMYFVSIDPESGRLARCTMKPMQMRQFRLHRASVRDELWLRELLNREGQKLGTRVERDDGVFVLHWQGGIS